MINFRKPIACWVKRMLCKHDYNPVFYARNKFSMCCRECLKVRKPDAYEIYKYDVCRSRTKEEIEAMTSQKKVDFVRRLDAKLSAIDKNN